MKVPFVDLPAQVASARTDYDRAIAAVLDRCSFCLGPDVAEFESRFAAFCHTREAVAVNSGTSALHLAMRLLDIGPGDEVITTPHTFIGTGWAISYVGARPVFVDIDPQTMLLEPSRIEAAVTPRTKAVIPVHLYGTPCDMDPLLAVASRLGLAVVEDACQAHGATYKGRQVGSFSTVGCFSFYPSKNLGAFGEGGALVTDRADFAQRARALREHGSTQRYFHDEVGYNYRMEGIQAAILNVKLTHLAARNAQRRQVAALYGKLLRDTPLRLPAVPADREGVWQLYVVRHARRDELKAFLEQQGIGCGLHYPVPLHLQRCYADLGYRAGDFPVAEATARECLSLPMYPEMTEEQVAAVAAAVRRFFA